MTEAQLRQMRGFAGPVYDYQDPMCDRLTRPNGSGYDGTIAEAEDEVQALRLLSDDRYIVQGGIRYDTDDDVRPVFWRVR